MDDFAFIQTELLARRQQWQRISEEADVSLSWIEKVARGKYGSQPGYQRIRNVAEWLRTHEVAQPA